MILHEKGMKGKSRRFIERKLYILFCFNSHPRGGTGQLPGGNSTPGLPPTYSVFRTLSPFLGVSILPKPPRSTRFDFSLSGEREDLFPQLSAESVSQKTYCSEQDFHQGGGRGKKSAPRNNVSFLRHH